MKFRAVIILLAVTLMIACDPIFTPTIAPSATPSSVPTATSLPLTATFSPANTPTITQFATQTPTAPPVTPTAYNYPYSISPALTPPLDELMQEYMWRGDAGAITVAQRHAIPYSDYRVRVIVHFTRDNVEIDRHIIIHSQGYRSATVSAPMLLLYNWAWSKDIETITMDGAWSQ